MAGQKLKNELLKKTFWAPDSGAVIIGKSIYLIFIAVMEEARRTLARQPGSSHCDPGLIFSSNILKNIFYIQNIIKFIKKIIKLINKIIIFASFFRMQSLGSG